MLNEPSFITPFLRGARVGAAIAGLTLMASLAGAVSVLVLQPDSASAATVATDAPPVPGERAMKARPAPVEIDSALLKALERPRPSAVGDLLFELSREAVATVEATEAAPPAAASVQAAPRLAPVIVPGDQLHALISEAFPDAADTAYAVAMCESSGNATANTGNGYYGLWQFDLSTWASVGGAGLPSNASVEEQVMRARMLYDARGWQPWGCAR